MSVFAYVGLPGGGKSYTVVEQQVIPALKQGLTVVTNIPLYRDLVQQDIGGDCREFPTELVAAEPEKIFEYAPNGCVLILDEVWRLFPAGLKANQVPEPFRTVFAEHRHRVDAQGRSMQIVLVTQDLAQISAFARLLVETTFRVTKLTSVGIYSRYRTDVYAGPVTGPNPPINSRLRQMFGRYDKKIYRYYKSHTLTEAGSDGAEERAVDRRANVLRRPLLLAAPVICLVLGWFGVHELRASTARLSHRQSERGAAGGRAGAPPGAGQASGAFGAVSAPTGVIRGPDAVSWRVSAVVRGLGGSVGDFAVVESSDSRVAWLPLSRCWTHLYGRVACPAPGGLYWDQDGTSFPAVAPPVAIPVRPELASR